VRSVVVVMVLEQRFAILHYAALRRNGATLLKASVHIYNDFGEHRKLEWKSS
jgi:hypothetical protein